MNSVIKLTSQNMNEIVANLWSEVGKYDGCKFIIDGNDIHDGRKKLSFAVLKLIGIRRRNDFDVEVINVDAISPMFKELGVTFPLSHSDCRR